MNANPDSVFALAARTATKVNSFDPPQKLVDEINQQSDHPYWKAIEAVFDPKPPQIEVMGQVTEKVALSLVLTSTGLAFGEWLMAREELHKFLTGETVVLRDLFTVSDELLARTNIMPFFRPAHATNRMAVDWKKKLGIDVWEEVGVMKFKNSKGSKVPELGFVNRSIRPDENTLGKKSKSPNDLLGVEMQKNQRWLNLFGYADADNLHFLITGKHLDQATWNWFPEDRLPNGSVARGSWYNANQSMFNCGSTEYCNPIIGARLAEFFPLKKTP